MSYNLRYRNFFLSDNKMKNKKILKIISVVTASFLFLTTSINDFAYAVSVPSAMQQIVTNTDSLKDFNVINNNIISYNLGKITSATNCNSDTVIVNIQDFHCNPDVQKNISDIISTFVDRYDIKSIYLEGGYGKINTKWLSDIKDENIRTQLIKALLENGSLTGAEYFSATNPSKNINLYGMETENIYKENFERLQNIFSYKQRYEQITKIFEKDLNFLQHKYLNVKNKKFNDLINKYRNGKIEARKYYKILFQYVNKYSEPTNGIYGTLLPIKTNDYPNIKTYILLGEYEKNIKFAKITAELKKILAALKTNISYEQYSNIIKNTNNLKDINELVTILNTMPQDFKDANFSNEIKNFINYVEISKQINPVKLVEEERILVENIRLALSKDEAEFDISYLSDFFNYFKDYLNTSITANNYQYFSKNFDKFKTLWDKYTYYNQINKYEKEFNLLSNYYETNVKRDYLFLEQIKKNISLKPGTNGKQDNNYFNILKSSKNIVLVVTGGFHTEGLKNIVTENKISYVVITPNIKGSADFANNRYEQLVEMPIQTLAEQAFQLPLLSNGERINVIYEGLKSLNIEPTQENVENLNITANEIISNLTGRKTRYNNLFETDETTININENKFSEIRNVIKTAIKNNIQFANPKNYADETFSFMKNFVSDSNGMIWEISQLPSEIIEQLRSMGYSEYLPEFLQNAYYNIGKKIKPGKEYEVSANNSPFMIKFPNGKIVVILREIDGTKYHIIDENFNWDTETKKQDKQQKRDINSEKTLVEKLEKQDYTKDDNGNSVIWLAEKQDNKIFIAATSDVEFINLNNKNLQENYCSQKQIDKDLETILNELNNNGNNQYSQNMINVLEIEDFSKLDDTQVVFISLQDYSNAEISKQNHIKNYLEYAIKNNKPIIIYPDLYVNDNDLSNADLNYLFGQLGEKFVGFADDYIVKLSQYIDELPNIKNVNDDKKTEVLTYSVKEILKNAFVYGTLSNLNKPIVINFDKTNPQIDILTLNEGKEENIYRKILTFSNKLRGYGLGIENIKEGVSKFNWQYLDNFKDEKRTVSRTSLKLNNQDSYLQIDKSKLKNNDYYNKVSNKILGIFKQNNIDINIDKNSRTFNFIVSLLLNNENITDKDLEKLNGTKTEIAKLILEAFNKKATGLDKTDKYYRTVLNRMENLTIVLELKEDEEINFVSFQVSGMDGNPKLFVTTKNEDRYGEGNNSPTIEFNEYFKTNKNYEVLNIHILDDRNTREKPFDNLLDTNKNEELKRNADKKVIETLGYKNDDLEIISLNDFVNYKIYNTPENLTQNTIKYLEEGKIVALFPPLHNLDLQNVNSFEELKYMYDIVRTLLWDFSEDFKKTNNAIKSGNIDVVLNEILKNAFVHGNNLKTKQPIYLYLKDDRFYIANVVDDKNVATAKQKSAATIAGLCGVHSGLENIQRYRGLDYKDEKKHSIFTASFKTNLKVTKKEYKLSYDKCPFIIEFPDKQKTPIAIVGEKINIGFGSMENYYIIDKNSDLNTRKKIDEIEEYGLSFDKKNNIIKWTGNIVIDELKKDNEQLINFYNDRKITDNNLKNNKVVKSVSDKDKDFVNAAEVHLYFLKLLGVDIDNISGEVLENIENYLYKSNIDSYPDIINMSEKQIKNLQEELQKIKIYVSDKEIKKQITNLKQVNIFINLEDYIKEPLLKYGIDTENLPNTIYDKYKRIEKYVNYNLKEENKPIIICPNLSSDIDDNKEINYGNLKYLFDTFGDNLIAFLKFYVPEICKTIKLDGSNDKEKNEFLKDLEEVLTYSLKEIIKNALVHGNFSNLTEPIVINFDRKNSNIDVLNENKTGEENIYNRLITLVTHIRGYGKGIEDINVKLEKLHKKHNKLIKTISNNAEYKYSDNFSDKNREISRASLKLREEKNNDKDKNVIYRGKNTESFIFKISDNIMFFITPISGPYKGRVHIVAVENNNIRDEGVLYFYPWAYGLEIKEENEETVIRKVKDLPGDISIIPVTEFSPMKFATVTLDEILRKYFPQNTIDLRKTTVEDNSYGTIFLEDLMRSDADKIMDMWGNIERNIKEGKPIKIYPLRKYNHEKVLTEITEQDYDNFVQLYRNLNIIITNFCNNYRDKFFEDEKFADLDDEQIKKLKKEFRYGLVEMIKNAIVHGNHLDLSKPLTLEFDKENFQINILNEYSQGAATTTLQHLSAIAGLAGFGLGIKKISEKDNLFKYSDNFNEANRKISCASLQIKDSNIMYEGNINEPFILKISNDMFFIKHLVDPFSKKSVYKILAKNNEIKKTTDPEYFSANNYNLKIIKEGNNIVIKKTGKLNDNITFIPVKEYSSDVALDELSRKYFNKETKIFDNDISENIFLEDLMRSNPDQIINISDKIDKNIKKGKTITIYPLRNYNHKKVISELSEQDYGMFIQLYTNLNSVISDFCDNYTDKLFDKLDDKTKTALKKELSYGLIEMIKNAIVHGNHLDLSKPVTLEFDKENFQINILNEFSKEETNSILQHFSVIAKLSGFQSGIEKISEKDNLFGYSDNLKDEKRKETRTSLKLKQKNNSDKIKNEIKSKIDIEDDMIEFLMKDIISIPDNELLKILKGTKSEILKMIFDEWDKTLFNLGPNSEIRKKLNKINIIVETNDNNSIAFGLLGIHAENGNAFGRYYGEEKIKDIIDNVINIHITYIDDNEFDNYEVEYKKALNKYRLSNNRHKFIEKEVINKMGFNRENLITLGIDEFIKDKESFKENLFSSLQKGNLVALFPFSSPETSAQDSIYKYKYVNREFFKPISSYLAEQMKINADNDISEILKNTFVHGNNLSFNKPIFLYIKNDRLYITNVVDKENIAENYQKTLAVLSNLTGYHQGIDFIESNTQLEFKYSDIDKLKTGDIYEASIKIGKIKKIKKDITFKGKFSNGADTSFMIELPDIKDYKAKYIYIQSIKGRLAIRAVDDKDNLSDDGEIQYLTELGTEQLEKYGIENINENDEDFEINFKDNVKFFRLSDKKRIKFGYGNALAKKRNEENKVFLNTAGIDTSKKTVDMSQKKLSNIKNIKDINAVLNLQDFDNDKSKRYIIEKNIEYALKNGIPIIVYPCLSNDIVDNDYSTLSFLFEVTSFKLQQFKNTSAEIISKNWNTDEQDVKFSLFEILKNSIVHGNNADLLLPLVVKSECDDKGNILKVDIINNNDSDTKINPDKKFIAVVNEWHGQGLGIEKMKNIKTLEYSDNNNNKDSRTPNDKIWTTSLAKKEKAIDKTVLFNKIKIDETTADYLIKRGFIDENCMDSLSNDNKTEFLIKLSESIEKKLRRNEFESIENINFIIERKDGTFISLKPMYVSYNEYKLNITAINGDYFDARKQPDLSLNELLSVNDKTEKINDVIENIYVFDGKDYIEYETKHTDNLKNFNTSVVENMLNMNDINKVDFDKENVTVFTLDSFIKDKEQFVSNLFNDLKQGKTVALFPFSLKETSIKDLIFMYKYLNKEFFVELSNMLAKEIKDNSELQITNNFSIAIHEILKNAFVHGNNLALDKPIFLSVKDEKLYISNIVDNEETTLTNYQKTAAVLANLTGVHSGNTFINAFIPLADYTYSDITDLKAGDVYEASIKIGNISQNSEQSKTAIKDDNLSKVYDLMLKGIPSSLVNSFIVLKETLGIFFTPNSFIKAHEQDRQEGAETLVKQANILKLAVFAFSVGLFSVATITGTLPLLLAVKLILSAVISMFAISAVTHYYINYEFVNNISDVIKNKKNIIELQNEKILNVKIINKNIDEDIYVNNIKLINSGLKVNGEIVWINKNNNELIVYSKGQNYDEILPVAKNIALKTTNTNKMTEFCIDRRENASDITEINGITTISSSVYNELKENKISDTEIAIALKNASIMEQKANTAYSVSKGNQIFLEYEIKDNISYNNFVDKVLAENLGFGYVIDIETINKYGKDFELKLEQAKGKNINIHIKGKDKPINFKRIENFNDIKTLEEKIEEINFSENMPLIPASKLFSLVDKERFTDKLTMLNKLADLLFLKREFNEEYVRYIANTSDKKLLEEISNYGVEKILKALKENNIEDISNIISQNPTVKIVFKKIEKNNIEKQELLKKEFVKTLAIRAILYNLSGNQMLKEEYTDKLIDIENLFMSILNDSAQYSRIKIKDNTLSFDDNGIEIIEKLQEEYGTEYSKIFENTKYNAITKLEYILTYLIDDNRELTKEDNDFNSTASIKLLLSAA